MASRYRKIDPRIWNDEKFRALTDDGKLVFMFLLTHPHMTALGAMRGTLPGLAAELGWTAKRFTAAAQESIASEIVEVCENASWIGIPNFIRYNEPEGPNSVTKAWITALDLLPECQEKRRLIQRCRAYLEARSDKFKDAMGNAIWDAFRDAIPDGKLQPCPIQEQEQEQEQEQDKDMPPAVDHEFEEFWNIFPARNGKKLEKSTAAKKFQSLKPEDRPLILTAVRHYASSDLVRKGIGIKDAHRWLRNGKDSEPWRDWLTPEQPINSQEVKNGKMQLPRVGFEERDYRQGVF